MAVTGKKTEVKSYLLKRRQLLHQTSRCEILSKGLSKKTFSLTQRASDWHLTRWVAQAWFTKTPTSAYNSDHTERNAWLSSRNIETSCTWSSTNKHQRLLINRSRFGNAQYCRKCTHLSQRLCDQWIWLTIKMAKQLLRNLFCVECNHSLSQDFIRVHAPTKSLSWPYVKQVFYYVSILTDLTVTDHYEIWIVKVCCWSLKFHGTLRRVDW